MVFTAGGQARGKHDSVFGDGEMGELSVSEFLTNNLGPEGPVLMQTYFYCLHIYFISPPKECVLNNLVQCIPDEITQFPDSFWENPLSHFLCTYLVGLVPVCYHSQCKRRQGKLRGEYLVDRGTVRHLLLS